MTQDFVLPLWIDLTAVAFGGLQGALYASRLADERKIDIVGVCAVGIACGVGGGIIRDLLLNQLPVAIEVNSYLVTALLAALGGMMLGHWLNKLEPVVVAVDALSLGLYLVVGTAKAAGFGVAPVPVILVGLLAATGGGVIRDVLLDVEVGLVQVGSFYAVAAVTGGVAFVLLDHWSERVPASVVAVAITFGLRMLSLRFGWSSPRPETLSIPRVARRVRRSQFRIPRRGRP